jgi:cytoskeletal protein CcmA (bactofilin family)
MEPDMKFRKDAPGEIQSLLGEGVELTGELSFTHGLRVDGIVRGKVRSEGSLVIGAKGRVEAEVIIERISINGEFRGAIHATDRVEIHKDGRVYGEIYTPCLIIEAGALFEGKCNMSDQKAMRSEEKAQIKAVSTGTDSASLPHAAGSERS